VAPARKLGWQECGRLGLGNALPLPDPYKRCPHCQMTRDRLHETNVHAGGKVPPRRSLISSHAALFITWGFRDSYRNSLPAASLINPK
jgi:hypothetical protein